MLISRKYPLISTSPIFSSISSFTLFLITFLLDCTNAADDSGKLISNFVLGYLKDSNAAAHSVESDIFYAVVHLSVRFKTYINLIFLKVRFKSILVLFMAQSCTQLKIGGSAFW